MEWLYLLLILLVILVAVVCWYSRSPQPQLEAYNQRIGWQESYIGLALETEPVMLCKGKALVISGKIPPASEYWSISALTSSRDDSFPVGDPACGIDFYSPHDGIAVVITSSVLLFDLIKADLQERWKLNHHHHLIEVVPIWVSPDRPYHFLANLAAKTAEDFEYSQYSTAVLCSDERPLHKRRRPSTYPREQHNLPETVWVAKASQLLANKGIEVDTEIEMREVETGDRSMLVFESEEIPEGTHFAVIAIDHVASSRSIYSSITYDSLVKLTGHSRNLKRETAVYIFVHQMRKTGRIREWIGAEMKSRLAPTNKSVLHCRVFRIK